MLRQLTNVNVPGASSINSTIGTQVSTDAAAWFKRVVQVAYDNTNIDHVNVAVRAVYHLLREYSGRFSETIREERTSVEADMKLLRTHGAGKRVTPTTSSTVTESGKELPGDPARPYFDNERFQRITPDPPPAV